VRTWARPGFFVCRWPWRGQRVDLAANRLESAAGLPADCTTRVYPIIDGSSAMSARASDRAWDAYLREGSDLALPATNDDFVGLVAA